MSSSYTVMVSYGLRRPVQWINQQVKQEPTQSIPDIDVNVQSIPDIDVNVQSIPDIDVNVQSIPDTDVNVPLPQEVSSTAEKSVESAGGPCRKPLCRWLLSLLLLILLVAAVGIPIGLILTGIVSNGTTETTTTTTTTTTSSSTSTTTTTSSTSTTTTTSTTSKTTTTTTTTRTTTTSTTSTTTVTVTLPPTYMYWTMDSTFNDFYNVYNGVGRNSPTFVTPGYNGYGAALSVNGTSSQYVLVPFYKNMTYTSFTWEIWAYPLNLDNYDNLMVGMCETTTTSRCLYLMIRTNSTYFAFFANDCWSTTIVPVNQWHHFGFVYDYAAQTQYIYLNGYLTCIHTLAPPFLGASGAITIGSINNTRSTPYYFWTGYLDEVQYVSRAKSADEVLQDATLVAYYSFDNGSFYDSGPNRINGTGVSVTSTTGRVNQGLLFNGNGQYFQANGFTLMGAVYRSYSISVWVYRSTPAVGNGTFIHLSAVPAGYGGWCLPILGLSPTAQVVGQNWNSTSAIGITGPILPLTTWTHLVTSYSSTNGVRLWVNGALIGSTGPFAYAPSTVPNTIIVGGAATSIGLCATGNILHGQFYGIMDELRVYARELNSTEVYTLANP